MWRGHWVLLQLINGLFISLTECWHYSSLNPSNAMAIIVRSTRTQRFLKTISTLSSWYSLDSSNWILSEEYTYARVSVTFSGYIVSFCKGQISHKQHYRVKCTFLKQTLWSSLMLLLMLMMILDTGLPWWPCGLRCCHWLLAVSDTTARVRNPPGACERVASDLGLDGGFAVYSGFLHQLQLASHNMAFIWQRKWRKT